MFNFLWLLVIFELLHTHKVDFWPSIRLRLKNRTLQYFPFELGIENLIQVSVPRCETPVLAFTFTSFLAFTDPPNSSLKDVDELQTDKHFPRVC
jgi:hypothetical protein